MGKIKNIKLIHRLMLPNFFLVGAAKAGTTSLWQYLKQHPEIFLPKSDLYKEPAHFCGEPGRGIKDRNDYLALFKGIDKHYKAVGECSTAYLSCIDSASLISKYARENNINVKIIIMLRNPADRAYSLYNWNVQSGIEPVSSFEEALKLEKFRKKMPLPTFWLPASYRKQYLYFETGFYADQILRYYENFPRENIYIGIFEEFIRNPLNLLQEIFKFLDVREWYEINLSPQNPSRAVISPRFQVLLRRITNLLIRFRIIRNFKSIKERDRLLRIGLKTEKPSPLDKSLRNALLEKYKRDMLIVEKLTGLDLSIWFD